jgi:hypothetical protein
VTKFRNVNENPIDIIQILISWIEKRNLINILRETQNQSPSLVGFLYITRSHNRGGGHEQTVVPPAELIDGDGRGLTHEYYPEPPTGVGSHLCLGLANFLGTRLLC